MTDPLRCVLVANRGEIARRILATARAMGLRTVAVYADPDQDAPFVADADLAVRLAGSTPAETYLRGDLIVAAAVAAGADCVHPGYGFLSENAAFARAVQDAGLIFIGPSPEAIQAMGSKLAAKELMVKAGVPTLPSVDVTDLAGPALSAAAAEIGYPVLVKASYGGGGRGMREVTDPAQLAEAVQAAGREAASAFGDGTVFLERLVISPRHVEVQVFGDHQDNVVALFERECSIQRRHQKVVEEAPSPAVDGALRSLLQDAAVRAARALAYVGAGTVEFLLAESGEFFFLEVNTRLQVEHPVTEAITGLDLVALQLRVAAGLPLPPEALTPTMTGHAIEVRLNAEDPAHRWLPQAGKLARFELAADSTFRRTTGPGIRLDSGVQTGSVIGTYYDPMLAKVIAWAPDRTAASLALAGALSRARLHGLVTNRDLLVNVLRSEEFLRGETDTAFLDRPGLDRWAAPLVGPVEHRLHAAAAALGGAALRRAAATVQPALPSGWRNNPTIPQTAVFDTASVHYRHGPDGPVVAVDGCALEIQLLGTEILGRDRVRLVLRWRGLRVAVDVAVAGDTTFVDSAYGSGTLVEQPRFPAPRATVAGGSLTASMPGTICRVAVAAGEHVQVGQVVVVLEAMKMEHPVTAPAAGLVTEVGVVLGQQVQTGAVLAVVEQSQEEPDAP